MATKYCTYFWELNEGDELVPEAFSATWPERLDRGDWTHVYLASDYDALASELAECRNSRQREHDSRVAMAGELESFKIRYQDEVNARVNAENELDAVRAGFVAELRKAKAALATARIAALALRGDER